MAIDLTITIGNIIEISVFTLAIAGFLIKRNNSINLITKELLEVQSEIKKLGDIITKMALANLRLDNTEQDIRELRSDVREIKHGRGFVKESIEKEWGKS